MSKGYTMSYFINEITEKISNKDQTNDIVNKLFPRKGLNSVKYNALCNWLGVDVISVVHGAYKYRGLGKTGKKRLLKALTFRKRTGFTI